MADHGIVRRLREPWPWEQPAPTNEIRRFTSYVGMVLRAPIYTRDVLPSSLHPYRATVDGKAAMVVDLGDRRHVLVRLPLPLDEAHERAMRGQFDG